MGTSSPFDEVALKAKVADLSRRLAEAEDALKAAIVDPPVREEKADGQKELLI